MSPPKKQLTGLPGVDQSSELADRIAQVSDAMVCPTCKGSARIVANRLGVHAYCGPCKTDWPISSSPLISDLAPTMERGLRKQTLINPDWDKAFEDH